MIKTARIGLAIVALAGAAATSEAKPKPKKAKPAPAKALVIEPTQPAKPRPTLVASPAPEVAALAKVLTGTWRCTGTLAAAPDEEVTAVARIKLDVNRVWLRDALEIKSATTAWSYDDALAYDAVSQRWRRLTLGSDGSYAVTSSEGLKDQALAWTGTGDGPGGAVQVRGALGMPDAKTMELRVERSADQGKTWGAVMALRCAR